MLDKCLICTQFDLFIVSGF